MATTIKGTEKATATTNLRRSVSYSARWAFSCRSSIVSPPAWLSGAVASGTGDSMTSYPTSRTAFARSSRPTAAGSNVTVARPVAKLTLACRTPGVSASVPSIVRAQAAQLIPVTGSATVRPGCSGITSSL